MVRSGKFHYTNKPEIWYDFKYNEVDNIYSINDLMEFKFHLNSYYNSSKTSTWVELIELFTYIKRSESYFYEFSFKEIKDFIIKVLGLCHYYFEKEDEPEQWELIDYKVEEIHAYY